MGTGKVGYLWRARTHRRRTAFVTVLGAAVIVGALLFPLAASANHDASDFFAFAQAEYGQAAEANCDGSQHSQVYVSGSTLQIRGRIHSNADFDAPGSGVTFHDAVTYGLHPGTCQGTAGSNTYNGGGPTNVNATPVGVTDGWPGDLASYLNPDGRTFGTDIQDILGAGAVCNLGTLSGGSDLVIDEDQDGMVVCNGTGKVELNAQNQTMSVTIISHGQIVISGQGATLSPAEHGILAWTDQDSSSAAESIIVSGSNFTVPDKAILFAPRSGIDVPGSNDSSLCIQLIAQGKIKVQGSTSTFGPGACEGPPPPQPQISVDKTPDSQTIAAGQPLSFTVTVNSSGTGSAHNVALTDNLPQDAGLDWSESPDNPSCAIAGALGAEVLSCNFGILDPGQSRTVSVTSPTDVNDCETYNNTANVTADGGLSDSDNGQITVQCPLVNGTITIVKDTVPNNSTNFSFTDTIPGCTVGPLDDDSNGSLSNQVVCSNVVPGSYTVSESDPSGLGYGLTNLVCTDANSTENIGTRTASIVLDSGESLTCTFTNSENGDITIRKDAVPDSATDFTFADDIPGCTIGSLDDDNNNTLDNDTECTNVPAGNYTVTENDPTSSGWALTGLSCSDSNSGENVGTRTASIVLDPGENLTCTFTNSQPPGSITIVKDTVPDGGTNFGFGDNIPSCSIDDLDDDGVGGSSTPNQDTCSNVPPGTYTVSEDNPGSGFTLTNLVCSDANSTENIGTRTATIVLEPGENVTCTFTNTQNGSITIVKDALPNGATDFPFTDTIPGCSIDTLDDDANGPLSNTDTCSNVPPGQYTVTESDPSATGFALSNLVCSDANSDENVGTRTATINLEPGESVTCTFTNSQSGSITIVKDAIPNGATDFTFSDNVPAPCTIGPLDDDADVTLSHQVVCANVPAGSYTVSESDPTAAGFALTNLVCSDADSTEDIPNRTAGINLAPGESLTCTFTNTQLPGSITIVKDAIPNGASDFAFSDNIPAPCTVGPLDDDAEGTLSNQVVCGNVPAGSYSVAETDPGLGFALTGLDCSDADSTENLVDRTASINLQPGENLTCTFTNTQNGTVTIVKNAVPDGPTDFTFTDDLPGQCVVGPLDDDADGALSNQVVCSNVVPGDYSVTENDPGPGFALTGLVCSDDDSSENVGGRTAGIDLDPGENLTCTFTNTQSGSVTIVKDAIPNGPTDFPFGDNLPGCDVGSLDDDADGTLSSQAVCANVAPGSYSVSENDPGAGFALTELVCSDDDSTEDLVNRVASIELGAGESVTCTFTNTASASVTIVKNAVPDGPADFTFTDNIAGCDVGPLDDDDADGTLSNQVLCPNVAPGQYSVSENDPGADFELTALGCTGDDGGQTDLAGRTASIDLDPGENVICTFTNTQDGTLIVDKVTVPSGETQSFGFTGTDLPGTADDTFGLTDAATPKSISVSPGTYHVSEDADPAGWKLTDLNCVDPSQDSSDAAREATAVVAAGETVTCTFTNTKQPGLTVIKTVINDNGGTAVAGNFAIQVTGTAPEPAAFNGAASPGTNVAIGTGSYNVTETEDTDYTATYSAGCSGELDAGETATCTITNDDKAPKLTLVKEVVNDNGGNAGPAAWTLAATGPDGFSGLGPSVSSGASFDQGMYSLSESGPGGYAASAWVCTGDGQEGSSVDVGLGDDITCTITNDDVPPKLTLVKEVVNDNGGSAEPSAWLLTASGPSGFDGVGPSVSSGPSFDQGTYDLSEFGPVGYDASDWDCGDGESQNQIDGDTVNVGLGDDVTCTITNDDQPATLIVIKNVVNDSGGTADAGDFQMTINGVTAEGGNSFAGEEAPGTSKTLTSVGAYNVTEAAVAGYTQTAASVDCSGSIALGETKTCTITNSDNALTILGQGAIDVQKTADPTSVKEPGGPVDFTVTITNTSSVVVTITSVVDSVFGDLDDSGGSGVFDVPLNLAPGEKVSKTFQRQVTGSGGQVHTNVVTASGSDANGIPVSDSDDARVEITPRLIDLTIVKTASSPTPLNGVVNYRMTVTNNGPDTATNVQLADPAPSGITYLTVSTSKGACNLTASLITCGLGDLAAGQTVTINVTARATSVGTHTNVATVTGGGGRETNPADNVDDAVTIVPAPFIPPTAKPKPQPKPVCLTLTVAPKMITADGRPDRVSVRVTAGKKRVKGTKITVFGSGIRKSERSNRNGMAFLKINPRKAGLITITAIETNQRVCGPKRIGVVGVFLPPLTG